LASVRGWERKRRRHILVLLLEHSSGIAVVGGAGLSGPLHWVEARPALLR
jgi:hypothetical protein